MGASLIMTGSGIDSGATFSSLSILDMENLESRSGAEFPSFSLEGKLGSNPTGVSPALLPLVLVLLVLLLVQLLLFIELKSPLGGVTVRLIGALTISAIGVIDLGLAGKTTISQKVKP